MKILIVSDTHGTMGDLMWALEDAGPIDKLIHLGDIEGCEDEILELVNCPVEMVAGNNDFFTGLDREKELRIGKYRVFLTHGHYYNVNMGTGMILDEAGSRGCDIVMFGHTHRPHLDQVGNITILNPGSLSYPRQEGRRPSYIMMEIDGKREAHFEVRYLGK